MNIAFIPVRGGSKSIPLKNIKLLAGKPLVYWTAMAANAALCIDKVVIATDSQKIKQAVKQFNLPKIEIYDRKEENAQDHSMTISVVLEYIDAAHLDNDDVFFIVQATSPLLKSKHIDAMYNQFIAEKADSALSCVRNKRFFWSKDGHPLNYDVKNRPRRQDFEGILMENGACYISTVGKINEEKNFLSGEILVFEMPEYTGIEVDEPDDFIMIEKLMKQHLND